MKEAISNNLGVPFVYLEDKGLYVCKSGVTFTDKEYSDGIDLQKEYIKRLNSPKSLVDFDYAKSTGFLRPKTVKKEYSSVLLIIAILTFVSIGCMIISTLHTAEYLFSYTGKPPAWVMSLCITLYSASAFEVSILFRNGKRYMLFLVFLVLWVLVTSFSMLTTVSVFYDRYNFTVAKQAKVEQKDKSLQKAATLLEKEQESIEKAIEAKKQDIAHRQSKDYSTRTQQVELAELEKKLEANFQSQRELAMSDSYIEVKEESSKENLFSFLGRLFHIEGSIIEFIASTLSALFINLISPLSLSAMVELTNKQRS